MTTTWIEASVRVERAHADVIESLLNGQGALAVTLSDCNDTPLWEPGVGETPLWGDVRVTGLFDADTDTGSLQAVLALAPVGYQAKHAYQKIRAGLSATYEPERVASRTLDPPGRRQTVLNWLTASTRSVPTPRRDAE